MPRERGVPPQREFRTAWELEAWAQEKDPGRAIPPGADCFTEKMPLPAGCGS